VNALPMEEVYHDGSSTTLRISFFCKLFFMTGSVIVGQNALEAA
jgi:hypothetical protein